MKTKLSFQDRCSLNAGQKYCRMLQESILQYFRPSLSYNLSLRPLFCLFLSDRLRQVLLYHCLFMKCNTKYLYRIYVSGDQIMAVTVPKWVTVPMTGIRISNGAKIRNRYNQVTHLTQDTNGKVTNSQLYTTNESQEVSPFPAGDHKAHLNRRTQRHSKHKTEKNIEYPQKKYRHGTDSKIFYWRAKSGLTVTNLTRSSDVDQDT